MDILEELDAIHEYGGEDGYIAGEAADFIRDLQSELARVQAERDAAVEDMKEYIRAQIKRESGVYACYLCKRAEINDMPDCEEKDCDGTSKWRWRGVKEDNNATSDV